MLKNISKSLENRIRSSISKTEANTLRLSTGKRINSAADDVAGSAITSRTKSRLKSIAMANHNISNAMEAISVANTGTELVSSHLVRMRELAVQAANGHYTDADRDLMQTEYQGHQESVQNLSLSTIAQDHLPVLNAGWVQLAFAIDVSGSMGGEISNLQSAINGGTSSLASLLDNNSIYTQFGLTAVGSKEDTTDGHHDGADTKAALGSPDFAEQLDALGASGQYEDPYSAIMSMVGALGDDSLGFTSLADQRHIVYITDTGREYTADASATKAAAMDALVQNGITFHAISSRGGPNALNDLVTATGGKTFPLASDGSNISSALDDVNDFVLENAEDKRPTQMLVGPDSSDVIQAELPINLTLNALGLQFSSSDIKTNTSANTAISQIDEAFQHIFKESSLLGATYNQLESSLAQNLNLKINTQEFLSSVEDVNYAMEVSTSVGMSLRARSSTEMLQKWFRIQSETLQSLLD